ncbi:RDD family protein [Streptomyces alkaliterrae]|uniref:RDD family protein n=1 Tax=Streptomyces alkaliterrae TaxID=2213162 RepID=A0A5P0YV53_9ACTN|nr:RDD family protein [Streptomyces alkaliterrae]MQS04175.1 RDD family protein [Streptomyces alkaliterrae]
MTGEAVVLGLQPARLVSRAMAVILDLFVLWSVYLLLLMVLLTAAGGLDEAARAAISVGLLVLVLMGGPVAVETLSGGRSLGKLACGLRVVREDGGPVRFRHALVRGLVGFVEIQLTLGVVAFFASLVSARGRRLGDVFAGTLVVRERAGVAGVARAGGSPVVAPPWVAERFATLDLSGVPDGLWLAVRQFLMRARELDPQVAAGMERRLADDLSSRLGTAPPPDLPPGAYLSGVLAERQRRESERAFGTPVPAGPVEAPPSAPGSTGQVTGVDAGRGAERSGGRAGTGFVPPG